MHSVLSADMRTGVAWVEREEVPIVVFIGEDSEILCPVVRVSKKTMPSIHASIWLWMINQSASATDISRPELKPQPSTTAPDLLCCCSLFGTGKIQ